MPLSDKLFISFFATLFVGFVLFFFGGYIAVYVSTAMLIGLVVLVFFTAFQIADFRNWSDREHWKSIGIKLVGALCLFLLAAGLLAILPRSPIYYLPHGPIRECEAGLSGVRCY